jgi:5'-3' exonuclease
MVAEWGAIVSAGCEADDLMGIKQFSNPDKSTVICTIDKDLKMIPGYHYNFVKGEFNDVKLKEANRFFFRQVLTGDATDNIPGIPGVGDKTAIKLTVNLDTDEDYIETICREYRKAYPETCQETIAEVSRLLWIMRRDNEDCPYVKIFQDGLSG